MSDTALMMWVPSVLIVTGFTIYFFIKVLKTPDKGEEDYPPGP